MPQFSFYATLTPTPDGKTSVAAQLTRTGVPDNWKDPSRFTPTWATKLSECEASTHPTETLNFVLPGKVDKITINDYEDILASVKQ